MTYSRLLFTALPKNTDASSLKSDRYRQGTILIIVAGISALLAALSVVFLTRMRSDVTETAAIVQEAQARIMLTAACMYIQESSRIGYDTGANVDHPEAYGWIDVRDGAIGPKPSAIPVSNSGNTTAINGAVFGTRNDDYFPVGSYRRCEMDVLEIPPFAISLAAAPNAIDPMVGTPFLSKPDPVPLLAPRSPTTIDPSEFRAFELGDPRVRSNSTGLAWFRLYRLGPTPHADYSTNYPAGYKQYNAATFIVTVGAGGSAGFRSWDEMKPEDRLRFGGNPTDPSIFNSLQSHEYKAWYLVEWSSAVAGQFHFNIDDRREEIFDADNEYYSPTSYAHFHHNVNRSGTDRAQGGGRNQGGTIRFIQRLITEPQQW